jgi:hypothetical protein
MDGFDNSDFLGTSDRWAAAPVSEAAYAINAAIEQAVRAPIGGPTADEGRLHGRVRNERHVDVDDVLMAWLKPYRRCPSGLYPEGDALVLATTAGRVLGLDRQGKPKWEVDVTGGKSARGRPFGHCREASMLCDVTDAPPAQR